MATEAAGQAAAGGFGARLRALEELVGTVVTVPSVGLAELTAEPLDFVWIDLEHGALGVGDVLPLAVAARAARAAALVRLAAVDAGDAAAVVDAGVEGVVAPRVERPADAARLVDRLRRPPRGSRGVAARRGSGYGRDGAPEPDPVCVVQIESPRAVDRAEEIATVDGVDALVVGCADLSHAMGADPRSATFVDAVEHVQHAAAGAGIASGIAGPDDPALLAELGGDAANVFVLPADVRMYARAVDSAAASLRRALSARPRNRLDAGVGA